MNRYLRSVIIGVLMFIFICVGVVIWYADKRWMGRGHTDDEWCTYYGLRLLPLKIVVTKKCVDLDLNALPKPEV